MRETWSLGHWSKGEWLCISHLASSARARTHTHTQRTHCINVVMKKLEQDIKFFIFCHKALRQDFSLNWKFAVLVWPAAWPASPWASIIPVFDAGIQAHAVMLSWFFLMWVLGIQTQINAHVWRASTLMPSPQLACFRGIQSQRLMVMFP